MDDQDDGDDGDDAPEERIVDRTHQGDDGQDTSDKEEHPFTDDRPHRQCDSEEDDGNYRHHDPCGHIFQSLKDERAEIRVRSFTAF